MSHEVIMEVIVVMSLIIAIALVSVVLFGRPARGGEIVICSASPSAGRWLYRDIDGAKCWFRPEPGIRRGREKSITELRWPVIEAPDIMLPEEIGPDQIMHPWDLELRWKGEPQ